MPHYLTKEGLVEIQTELEKILQVDLPQTQEAINVAREDGDLKENAAYQTAMKVRDELEARKIEIEEVLKNYEIIATVKSGTKTIQIGSSLKLKYTSPNKEFTVKIVGSSESDILSGKISNESPLAQSIVGKKAGQKAKFKSPQGQVEVEILEIL